MDGPVNYALYGILKMCINFTKEDVLSFFLRRENFFQKKIYIRKQNLDSGKK